MVEKLLGYTLQYGIYFLEAGMVIFLLSGGRWKRLKGVGLYLSLLVLVDGIGRNYVLIRYGFQSHQYRYAYWLSDVFLTLAAFLLICSFFRRTPFHEGERWKYFRFSLGAVFVLVLGVSSVTLFRNYEHIFSAYIYEFSQNLFFTCLVLNTFLYILMQQTESRDEELELLVCGLGIQFAGPAAGMALVRLTPGYHSAQFLYTLVSPLCTLGMLLTWFYAVSREAGTVLAKTVNARKKATILAALGVTGLR
jgi:hypothetical protein